MDCSIAEMKKGVLFIETFKKLFSPQSDGHLGLSLMAFLAHPIRHTIIDMCAVDLSWKRKNGSSAESVVKVRFRQLAKCMI